MSKTPDGIFIVTFLFVGVIVGGAALIKGCASTAPSPSDMVKVAAVDIAASGAKKAVEKWKTHREEKKASELEHLRNQNAALSEFSKDAIEILEWIDEKRGTEAFQDKLPEKLKSLEKKKQAVIESQN